jgi:asparagine synthase (glutamine-hydrolysing)
MDKNTGISCVKTMLEKSYHRGPDSEGQYGDDKVCLGVRRLSIIDMESGQQPIYSADKKLVLIFNGEIYNHRELRESLISAGVVFNSRSDSEVIVHLYRKYGTNCLGHLKGMFSFALWDRERRVLFAARDRFGIKPLYYYFADGIFCFSSELRALAGLSFIEKRLNKEALGLYFSLEYIPSPYSILEDVSKVRPAHYILYDGQKLENKSYWNICSSERNRKLSGSEASARAFYLMKNSVKQHLISDVPVGVFLSGGIDSTALAYMAKNEKSGPLASFTIGFDEDTFDESNYARLAAEHLGTDHTEYIFTFDEFMKGFDGAQKLLDEPFADISIFPSFMLASMSRKKIKVALSGEGADELFMGYPTYKAHRYFKYVNMFPDELKSAFYLFLDKMPVSFKYLTFEYKVKKFFENANEKNALKRHLEWMGAFSPRTLKDMFLPGVLPDKDLLDDYIKRVLNVPDKSGLYKKIQYLDIYTYLSEDLLVKADRSSMAASLELRVPYLDHELVEFICSLRDSLVWRKKLIKRIFKGKIPDFVIKRPKKGFAIPFSLWLSDKRFLDRIMPYFDSNYISRQGIFEHKFVRNMLDEHLLHKRNNRKPLRAYIMFQRWYESVMK